MGFEDVVGLGLLGLDRSRQGGLDVLGRGCHEELIFALGNHPRRCCLVERSQVGRLHGECQRLALTSLQGLGLGKGLELLGGFVGCLGIGCSDVEFYDLLTLTLTSVLDGDGNGDGIIRLADLGVAILEGGVAQTEAEGIAEWCSSDRSRRDS